MYIITHPLNDINIDKLHCELGDLGVDYSLNHNDQEFYIQFVQIYETLSHDENEQEIRSYTIEVKSQVMDDDGNSISVTSQEPFDMYALKAQIDSVIAEHDPTPMSQELTEAQKMQIQIDQIMIAVLGV